MRGTIIKRGGGYSVVLDLGRGPDGKRLRRWHSGYRTKKDAERARVELLGRLDQATYVDPSKTTLSDFLDRWLQHMGTVRDARTVERYGELLRLHVRPTLAGVPLQKLTPVHFTDLYARLLAEGRRDGRPGGLSPRTVGHVHRALHRALHQAVRWRLLATNPAGDLELPPAGKTEMVTLDHQQAARLLAAVEEAPGWLRMLVTLGLALGCRRGELLALRWADVDLDEGTVRVGRSLRIVGGRLDVKGPKTEAGYRTLALPGFAVAALRRHRAAQAELRLALGGTYHDEDLVVCQPDGRPVRPDYASAAFRTLVARAELPAAVHVHTLRHSAASLLAAAGVPASDIAAQLGHTDGGQLALRVYVHPLEENKRRAAAILDGIIGGAQ